MSKEFKIGDLVYYPEISTKVLELTKDPCDSEFNRYPLRVTVDNSVYNFTTDGKHSLTAELPILFHATPENHELLETLYGVEFESLSVKPTNKEIVQAMLARGDKAVLCYVHDLDEKPSELNAPYALVKDIIDGRYISTAGVVWKYATPFDPRTGEPITELPEEAEPTRRMATLTVPHYNS